MAPEKDNVQAVCPIEAGTTTLGGCQPQLPLAAPLPITDLFAQATVDLLDRLRLSPGFTGFVHTRVHKPNVQLSDDGVGTAVGQVQGDLIPPVQRVESLLDDSPVLDVRDLLAVGRLKHEAGLGALGARPGETLVEQVEGLLRLRARHGDALFLRGRAIAAAPTASRTATSQAPATTQRRRKDPRPMR